MASNFNGTEEQLKIFDSDAEVKRVIACAGSGKTWVITNNIIKILEEGLCNPNGILALTFTRNAAENMRVRIKEKIKKKLDFENMDILTFNSFGNEIIRENSFEFGLGKGFKLLNSAESWQVIYEIFDSFNFKNVSVGKNVGKFIDDLLIYIQNLKNNLIRVSDFEEYIKNYNEILISYKSEALKNEEVKVAEYQKELFDVYSGYERSKRDKNCIDYSDQILLPYFLLTENKRLGKKYKYKYKYIFIDEFQDTNIAQAYLFSLLYNPGYNKIMVVGDDDQGIYSFRGACVENILNFHKWDIYRKSSVSDFYLTVNFRSGKNIISTANNIIAENKNRFSKELKPENEKKDSKVIFCYNKTHREEAQQISKIIKHLMEKGVKLKEIAILARRKRFSVIVEELEKNNIKYELVGGKNFFFKPEVSFIISWLRIIHNTYDEINLIHILKSGKYKICDRDIYFLRRYKHTQNNYSTVLKEGNPSIIDGLLNCKQNPYIGNLSKNRMADFLNDLRFYISKSKTLKLKELISLIFHRSGMNDEIKSKFGSGYKEKIKNVENLIKVSSDFEQNNFGSSLDSFIIYLRDVAKSDYDDPDTTELSGENSVKIMSVHAAKGLEFEVVFLPMLWKSDYIGRKSSRGKFEIPSCLRKDGKIWKEKKDYTSRKKFEEALKSIRTEEERRIFYVACSRAKKVLALLYCEFESEEDANKKESQGREIVPFFADAIRGNNELSVINLKGAEYIRNKINKNFNKNIESYSDAINFIGLKGRHRGEVASGEKAGNIAASRLFTESDQKESEKSLSVLINKLNAVPDSGKKIYKIFKDLNTDLELNCNLIDANKLEQWRNRIKFTGHGSCNLAVLEKTGRKKGVAEKNFSLTSILDYIKCPVLYKWKYIYKIPGPETERLRLGERVHKCIEYITMAKLGDLMGKPFPGKNIDEDEILEKIKDEELKKYIETFLNSNLLKFNDIEFLLLEQLFYWKLSGYFITGKIDRMDMRKDGKIRIIDYKVSNYSVKRKNVQHENQLKSYISSACEIYKKSASDIYGCLFYLGNSKKIELSFKDKQIKEFEALVLDIIKKINKNIFDADMTSSCKKDCSYYDLCAYINSR